MVEPSSHAAGLASKVESGQAFWMVVSREGSAIGSTSFVLPMFASPGDAAILTVRLAPLGLLALPCVEAVSFGWNGSAPQLPTWKGVETGTLAPPSPPSVPVIVIGEQLVGLNSKLGRSTTTSTLCSCSGMPELGMPTPCTLVGRTVLIVTAGGLPGGVVAAAATRGARRGRAR